MLDATAHAISHIHGLRKIAYLNVHERLNVIRDLGADLGFRLYWDDLDTE